MQNYRVQVETNDGCCTIWYEKAKLNKLVTIDQANANNCLRIQNRVYNQLQGLNLRRVTVDAL